jgi:tetratricopeptide (TPR) repeat protein
MGKNEQEKQAYEEAAIYKAAVSEISLFRALALKELKKYDTANEVLEEMIKVADNLIANKDLRTYYGVGSPSPMPFEYDIEKNNLRDGSILKAFALLGYNKPAEAEACMTTARKLDPNDFRIFAFDKIK